MAAGWKRQQRHLDNFKKLWSEGLRVQEEREAKAWELAGGGEGMSAEDKAKAWELEWGMRVRADKMALTEAMADGGREATDGEMAMAEMMGLRG